MSYPGQGGQDWQQGQPPQGQPNWQQGPPSQAQPTQGQQNWPQPGTGAQPYGQPGQQYDPSGQQAYGHPGQQQHDPTGQQQYGYPAQGGAQPPSASKSKRGLLIGLVVLLLVVVGGGVTWFAISRSGSTEAGAQTPTDAVQNLAQVLDSGDLLGVLESLAPGEAAVLAGSSEETIAEYKRLKLLDESADPRKISGLEIRTKDLKFEGQPEVVNDHVNIVKITGGQLTMSADLTKLPIGAKFKDAIIPPGTDTSGKTQTLDIAKDIVAPTGQPLSIATVKSDGEWYPSLFYTVAHYALKEQGQPWPSTPIAANGAASAEEAVKELVSAIQRADVKRVIELMPPDELAVLHDVGPAIVDAIGPQEPLDFELANLVTAATEVDGGTRLALKEIELREPGGPGVMKVKHDGKCYSIDVDGQSQRFCTDNLPPELWLAVEQAASRPLTSDERARVQRLLDKLVEPGIGVVTTEVDGKHYVSPFRTLNDLGLTVLRAAEPEDLEVLLGSN